MKKPAHNLMAYNSQVVVDDKYKFIVATNVTSQGNDLQELHNMSIQTKENLELNKDDKLDIVADNNTILIFGFIALISINKDSS